MMTSQLMFTTLTQGQHEGGVAIGHVNTVHCSRMYNLLLPTGRVAMEEKGMYFATLACDIESHSILVMIMLMNSHAIASTHSNKI